MDQFGSHGNRAPLLLLQRSLNQIKGRVFGDAVNPEERRGFEIRLERVARTSQGEAGLFQSLREVSNYGNTFRRGTCRIDAMLPSAPAPSHLLGKEKR